MIKPGDRGDVVTAVTNTLHRLGLIAEPTDIFSEEVASAVRAFQQERGLRVTGEIDVGTHAAIEEAGIAHSKLIHLLCAVMMLLHCRAV
jgi:peptidoglycan hydrolase-like protein with peptidoglycan-binding domain